MYSTPWGKMGQKMGQKDGSKRWVKEKGQNKQPYCMYLEMEKKVFTASFHSKDSAVFAKCNVVKFLCGEYFKRRQ